jgi:hypothetical protein
MPVLTDALAQHAVTGSTYGFSGTRIEHLGATEYTVVSLAADVSYSTTDFLRDIEACIGRVVMACHRSPRADNLLLRVTRFGSTLDEVHGFKPLGEVGPATYDGALECLGCTALYDAAHNAVESVARYGAHLAEHALQANGLVFVVTDGMDNESAQTAADVRAAIVSTVAAEKLESLVTVLVGVNVTDSGVQDALRTFSKEAGFTRYVELDAADESTLAALSEFVTRSISLQSRALGSGQAALVF